MTRVVCPLCRTGFEASISRDNFAVNCVACGVAFNALNFLSKDDFATKSERRAGATATSGGGNGNRPATGTCASAPPGRASHSTRTGALPFTPAPNATPKAQPPATVPQEERKPIHELRQELKQIRAKLHARTAEQAGQAAASSAPAPGVAPAESNGAAPPLTPPSPQGGEGRVRGVAASAAKHPEQARKTTGRRPLLEGAFGPYDIESEIARGGVGAVFRARERETGRVVALKVLLEGPEAGEAERERFERECETAKALSLPGMVQVYAVGEHEGRPYMAMELINGRSLDKIIPEKSLAVHECLVLMKSVAETIGALHEAGYVHRDLKPGNILIDSFNSPKVADFGLVKSLDEVTRMTASGLVCGTPAYMAPEQARGDGKAVDPRSDVWALGAVLYEMLAAQPPFQAENALRLMLRITQSQPTPLRQLNLKVPQDVQHIVAKCLEKNAARRYPNGRALAADIGRFLNGEPLAVDVQPRMQQLVAKATQHRRPLLAAAVAISALLAVAVLARIVFAPREAAPLVERGYRILNDSTLAEAQRLDKAQKCFREAMSLDARRGRAYLGLGLCLGCQGIDRLAQRIVDSRKLSEAMAATNQAAELDPQLAAECHAQVARFNMWLKRYVEEARELEQAVEFASGNLKYREALALAYWNAGVQISSPDYYKRAVRELQIILRDDPYYPRAHEYIKQLQERFITSNVSLNARTGR